MSKMAFHHVTWTVLLLLFITVQISDAWIWSMLDDESSKGTDLENTEDVDNNESVSQTTENTGMEPVEEEEEADNERNLRCSQHFNRNLYKILKSIMPSNSTDRISRQDDSDTDPNELVESMLNLELSQIVGPVLRIVGSAAANNATAIDENYKTLPLAVRYQVTDFIKFTIDLLTTT